MQQLTRNNHYVPQWYQRGFLPKGKHKLEVLNLNPSCSTLPNGSVLREQEIESLGPKLAFKEFDLYTTRFGQILNDDIEKFLFGEIDTSGARAVRAWIAGNVVEIHQSFRDFFQYLDAQKLRTPKGLDWIQRHFNQLPHLELMRQMQALRQMHATMWSECVREIVSASSSAVKFIVSDHPVTIFHPDLAPGTEACQYPNDPGIELVGSQTIFVLDANHCLILTNLEYAEDPAGASRLARRTNARFRGSSLAKTDAFIRGRELREEDVIAVNHVLKSRARKFVAASDLAWLFPERLCNLAWPDIAGILMPKDSLWGFGGEIFIGHNDGTTSYRDKFGRTSRAHQFLVKKPKSQEPAPEELCGCGSGLAFSDCCYGTPVHQRPAWNALSIRERNLVLCRAIRGILEMKEETVWLDVRRRFSDDHVRRINELFAGLWPEDTQLVELLPRPQSRRSRGLLLGMIDARSLHRSVLGMLAYVDELVVVHPFVNAHGLRSEYSAIAFPSKFKEQTLRNAVVLLLLEPAIAAGRVHLVPDPLDYDVGFREEIKAIVGPSDEDVVLGSLDAREASQLAHDESMRTIKRLPPKELKGYLERLSARAPERLSEHDLDSVVHLWKRELEEDPLALLDPPASSREGGEWRTYKGFGRETGLFIATLTGSFVYTMSDTQWARLHQTDGVHQYVPDPASRPAVDGLSSLAFQLPAQAFTDWESPADAAAVRTYLREWVVALRQGRSASVHSVKRHDCPAADEESETLRVQASIPRGGFQRTDVSRLVVTFGRTDDIAEVTLALFVSPQRAVIGAVTT